MKEKQINHRRDLKQRTSSMHQHVEDVFAAFEIETVEGSWNMVRVHILALRRLRPAFPSHCPYGKEVDRLLGLVPAHHPRLARLDQVQAEIDPSTLHPLAIAYVILGSRLGAQLLSRELDRSTDDIAPEVRSFLGDTHSLPVWKNLCSEIEAVETEQDHHAIRDDAIAVFQFYERVAKALLQQDKRVFA